MSMCRCGHEKAMHIIIRGSKRGECHARYCKCERYNPQVSGTSKYCQDTPPPTYSPSPEPEPIQW